MVAGVRSVAGGGEPLSAREVEAWCEPAEGPVWGSKPWFGRKFKHILPRGN